MRLGVFGGTFDPVHIGHLRLAENAREDEALSLDKVLFVPAGEPWRKKDRLVSAAAHRATMLRLAIEGNDAFELSTIEVEREGPSYTVDTLEALGKQHPGAELFLIMGEDALADLPNWHEPAQIMSLAKLAVASRGDSSPERLDAIQKVLPEIMASVVSVPMEVLQISGSLIRESVRRGRSIRFLVPPAVEAYIHERALYRD
ncbi:MAG TPA: nicotinate-nucleotide adenylyltransferase [Dehalococcoidia bacterium]|jgi:nicotinate-nucleotide adenylyltransferase|nr:nicotinate-nucleotide adenylyltransferase [Dehalococcoidia bacterium]